ncbi:anti-sigma factor family protein [Cupriavidus sp. 30B13]|uniref:anti-sigma factor family protein n=1 Tax=Cupriavidus sp. 30B13 TaxID=3384241 RepID=UPI003B8FAB33
MNHNRNPAMPPGPELERLSALVDGELPPQAREDVLAGLARDEEAAARVADYQRHGAALRALFPLEHDVRYVVVRPRPHAWRRGAAALGFVAVGLALGTGVAWLPDSAADTYAFAHHADLAYAVFSTEQRHAVEVPASDHEHLVTWLSHRLSRSLTIPVLDEFGYRLMGGRLLPGATGPAAQLMYENRAGERLTVYIAPASSPQDSFRVLRQDGRSTFYWTAGGTGYAVSGQHSEPRLREIALDVCGSLGCTPESWQ